MDRKERNKKYYQATKDKRKLEYEYNKEVYQAKSKLYRDTHKEQINEQRKTYREKNKKHINDHMKQRGYNDLLFRLSRNIRARISQSIKKTKFNKFTKTELILGCTYEEFKIYLESKFEVWMCWDNYGMYNGTFNYGWDIDHIIPTSSATSQDEIIKLNHYTNLQPLCSKINRDIKNNRLDEF